MSMMMHHHVFELILDIFEQLLTDFRSQDVPKQSYFPF